MRPVRRGVSPQPEDYKDYRDALPDLVSRLGCYCSYCERRIPANLAVEHIQPKGLPEYGHLTGRWENFLLGCVNCNSTKKDKDVRLERTLLPDRDNTYAAFTYRPDGKVIPAPGLEPVLFAMAEKTLSLTGLDKKISSAVDDNGKLVALDRMAQRMEVWAIAMEAKNDLAMNPDSENLKKWVVNNALAYGYFSVWLTVFDEEADMKNRLIDSFPGTRASGCFESIAASPVSPGPNPDKLPCGGKL